ncbi:MAG TPA: phosphatase PAP2 family protein, partial [Pseudomonadales bacterium]|nr:phosphatase PAP2 family protein [Pseudomonadales bacterium]
RAAWDAIDQSVFFYLNGTIATPSTWSALWAVLNSRIMDLIPLLLLLPFLLIPNLVTQREERLRACCELLIILAVMLVVRYVFSYVIEWLHWRGNSPTLTLQPAHLLSQMYPQFHPKDSSSHSFPGDHSGVLMIVTGFLLLQRVNRWSFLACAIASVFFLPRLFSGAHWFSDVVVGGGFIASLSIAIGYFVSSSRHGAAALAQKICQHRFTPVWLR